MAQLQLDNRSQNSGPNINPARVLDRVIRFWYIVAVSLIIALGVAYLVNRYSTRIYPISASLIVRESEENMGAKFLYNNSLVSGYRNYFNEFYLMRSFPLMQKVVTDLHLDVVFYQRGEIKTTELYLPHFPVRILVPKGYTLPYGKSFRYKILSEHEFMWVVEKEDDKENSLIKYNYNDTIQVDDFRFYFNKTEPFNGRWIGAEFVVSFVDPYVLAKHYSSSLQLNWAQQGAGVINVYLQGAVPEKEKDFMTRFIEYYQMYDVDRKAVMATKSISFLDKQVKNISDSLRYYEDKIAQITLNFREADAEKGIERLTVLGESLDEKEVQMRLQDRYYSYLESYLNTKSDFDQVLLPSSLGVSDPILTGIITNLAKLQMEVRILQTQVDKTSNPLVNEAKEKIELFKRDISEGIRSAKEIMRINRNLLKERLQELERSLSINNQPDKSFANAQRNYKQNEQLYMYLIQKRAEAAISQASTTSDITVVNNPAAGSPISPVPQRNYIIALAIGILLPLTIFVLMEFFNNKVQSKEDIEASCTVPVIGTVGHNSVESNLAVVEKPRSYLAESFRALRSNLNFFTEGKDKKIILITSSISGEGKTFTSINISSVIAFTGKRVILIGGDMRKDAIAKDFDVSNRTGLSLYLSGQASMEEVILKTKVSGLDFIPPGPSPPNPAELYLGNHIDELLKVLLERYDYVMIDSPPVGLVSDALALIPRVDHILFVARQNYTPITAIKQLQFMVDQGQVQHVSIVLNDIMKVGMGYGYKYGYAYDYGYGYRYGQNSYYGKSGNAKEDDLYYDS